MIDRIDGPGIIKSAQPVKRTTKSGSTGGSSFAKHLDDSSESGAATGVTSAAAIAGVLGVQEVDDALERASRGKMRAEDILDQLDSLRVDILTGAISRDKLLQLAHIVHARRLEVTDPRLGEILDEIDLRAQVELAKYSPSTSA